MPEINLVEYAPHCFVCEKNKNILMIGHRSTNEKLVGFLFICEKCFDDTSSKQLIIDLKD